MIGKCPIADLPSGSVYPPGVTPGLLEADTSGVGELLKTYDSRNNRADVRMQKINVIGD
jgi:hypothetical protein